MKTWYGGAHKLFKKGMYILFACFLTLCLTSGCKHNLTQNEQKEIIEIPPKVMSIAGMDGEQMRQNFEELSTFSGKQFYCETADTSDGGVEVTILERERSDWLKSLQEAYSILAQKSNIAEKGYRVEFAEDFSSFDTYIDRTVTTEDTVYCIMAPELTCAYYQLFSGIGSDDWYVEINVYNLKTGKLLVQGNSNSVLRITESDWEASE